MAAVILFDRICGLCRTGVRFVAERDPNKQFSFVPMQSPLGQEVLRHYGLPSENFSTFVVVTPTGHYTKSTAACHIWRQMPGLWPLLYALILIPRPLRDWVYDWVVRKRFSIMGKVSQEECTLGVEIHTEVGVYTGKNHEVFNVLQHLLSEQRFRNT